MKTITFYSYKGGVGRSLALANIAIRLCEIGKKVCVIDFDLEAPGLHHKFKKYFNSKRIVRGIVDYLSLYNLNNVQPGKISSYNVNFEIGKRYNNSLNFIPAGNVNSNDYWQKLNKVNWNRLFFDDDSNGLEFFLDMKSKIISELNPDVLLIDSRTGITDISSMTMSILADEVVLIGSNNRENKEGLKMIVNSLLRIENPINGIHPKLHLVLSRIPVPLNNIELRRESFLKDEFLEEINSSIANLKKSIENVHILHSDRELELLETFKIDQHLDSDYENFKLREYPTLGNDYSKLFDSLTYDLLNNSEIEKFKKFKKAELILNRVEREKNSYKKVELLNEVLTLDEKLEEAYYLLGVNYFEGLQYESSRDSFSKLLELNPSSIRANLGLAKIEFTLKNFDKAEELYKRVLGLITGNIEAIESLAEIYSSNGKEEESLKYYKRLIQLLPNKSKYYNDYADTLNKLGRHEEALSVIYEGIKINPKSGYVYSTLAEINFKLNNLDEFYRNVELAIAFDFPILKFIYKDEVYQNFIGDSKFLSILKKFGLELDEI